MNQQENDLASAGRPSNAGPMQDLAETLCHHLALDQQIILRLFRRNASGELSNEQFVALLSSFSRELPRRKRVIVEALAGAIESGESFINAFASLKSSLRRKNQNLRMMEIALVNARDRNALPAFLDAVSEYRPTRRPLAFLYHDTMRKRMIRLMVKTAVILQVVVFLMLFIAPEFVKIFIEFGIELPYSFRFVLQACDLGAKYWFLFPLLLFLIFRRHLFPRAWLRLLRRMIAKFSPWSWRQRPLSKKQQQELSIALTGIPENAKLASLPSLNKNEKQAFETACSENTKSWLLSRRVREDGQRKVVWSNRFGELLIAVWNVVLACIVAAFAISIVSCLITIIEGVAGVE